MHRSSEAGFSLVETITALGLLAAVIVSTVTLFTLGERSVQSGRNSSESLALARAILEELQGFSFWQTYGAFGFSGSSAAYLADSRSNSYASKWQPVLDAALEGAHATVLIESVAPGVAPALEDAQALRVVVTVSWNENDRGRDVRLSAVKQ